MTAAKTAYTVIVIIHEYKDKRTSSSWWKNTPYKGNININKIQTDPTPKEAFNIPPEKAQMTRQRAYQIAPAKDLNKYTAGSPKTAQVSK